MIAFARFQMLSDITHHLYGYGDPAKYTGPTNTGSLVWQLPPLWLQMCPLLVAQPGIKTPPLGLCSLAAHHHQRSTA
eukprot:12777851-Ditylum_brightwellii.AAC.2